MQSPLNMQDWECRTCDWIKKGEETGSCFTGSTGDLLSTVIGSSSYLLEVAESRGGQKKDESGMLMMLIRRGDLSSLTGMGERAAKQQETWEKRKFGGRRGEVKGERDE